MSDEYVFCPDCKLRRYLSSHAMASDQKTCARKWIQINCPRGLKRGCSTRLSSAKATHEAIRSKMYIIGKRSKKGAA